MPDHSTSAHDKLQFIADERARLEREGLLVEPRTIQSPQGAWITVDGKKVLNLCSNNYLGFANAPRLKAAACKAIEEFGVGPAAVRTIAGTTSLHTELEQKLAQFKGVEATISFQSGFSSNIATIPALVGKDDVIFSDELNHASIIDGCRLSGRTDHPLRTLQPGLARAKARRALPPGQRPPSPDHQRRRFFDGRRHRAAAAPGGAGRALQRDGHGR